MNVYGGNATEVVIYSLTTDVWWKIYVAALQTDQELEKVGPNYVWLGKPVAPDTNVTLCQ